MAGLSDYQGNSGFREAIFSRNLSYLSAIFCLKIAQLFKELGDKVVHLYLSGHGQIITQKAVEQGYLVI